MTLARLSAVRPNPDRRRLPPAGVVAPSPADGRAVGDAELLRLQRMAGNAAVATLVQRQPNGPESIPGEVAGTPAAAVPERKTLRYGSTGEDVKLLQMKLRQLRERAHDRDVGMRARIDGIFGPLTRQDVADFQADTGLEADGVVGPRTWHAIDTLVPGTPTEAGERASDEQFEAALALRDATRYDEAIGLFETAVARDDAPDRRVVAHSNTGICHQQRGRFGLAVASYERALTGRFNQEDLRAAILENLVRARRNEFLDSPAPDPEPLPPGADAATATGREGGGVTERQPVKVGEAGPAVDLFKGKLGHMMLGWPPRQTGDNTFGAEAVAVTRLFQQACGLDQTGEGDASTWHALDSFTKADVPMSVLFPLMKRAIATQAIRDSDPAASLPLYEGLRGDAQALGLTELVKTVEREIGAAHHRLSHFSLAVEHYEHYLDRIIAEPADIGRALEDLRRARQGLPPA